VAKKSINTDLEVKGSYKMAMEPGVKVSKTLHGFLLDTNIFDHLAKRKISADQLPNRFPIFVTPSQKAEIMADSDEQNRNKMLQFFQVIPDHLIPVHTTVLGVTVLGGAKMGAGTIYNKILERLNKKDPKRMRANTHDALTGEVAIEVGLELITHDKYLAKVVRELGGYTLAFIQKDLSLRSAGLQKDCD